MLRSDVADHAAWRLVAAAAFLSGLAADRERLAADGPPGLTQLAAQVALMEAALVTLADTSPNREALQRWLQVAGAEAVHASPAGHRIRAAARLLAERLGA